MLDTLTLDQMRIFVAIAESGSFRAAAAHVSRVQSAVSHAIANMEADLQVTLFDRSGHKPVLTPEGTAILADIRAILVKVDATRARARGVRMGLESKLPVAVDPRIPLAVMAAALANLHARYPTVAVEFTTAPLGAALHAVLTKKCALAVTTAVMHDPHVETQAIASAPPSVAVCAATHPLAARAVGGELWSADEFTNHLQIVVADPSPLTEGQTFGVLSPGTWRVSDFSTKHALILAGIGWGNLPYWMVEKDLEAGRLARVPVVGLGAQGEKEINAYLLRRIDHPLGPAAAFLRAALIEHFSSPQ